MSIKLKIKLDRKVLSESSEAIKNKYKEIKETLVSLYIGYKKPGEFKKAIQTQFGKNLVNSFDTFLKVLKSGDKERKNTYGEVETSLEMRIAQQLLNDFYNEMSLGTRELYKQYIGRSENTKWLEDEI